MLVIHKHIAQYMSTKNKSNDSKHTKDMGCGIEGKAGKGLGVDNNCM